MNKYSDYYLKEDLFLFNYLMINKYKITFLIKSNIALVGVFSFNTTKGYQNLLLIHLFISLINYKGDFLTKLNLINNYINSQKNINEEKQITFKELQESHNELIINGKTQNITRGDFLEMSIYEKYFVKSCIIHFEKVFNILTKKEDINLKFTKFLDLYIIDISSELILFNLNSIFNPNPYHKYYKNKNIFKEILFHSHQLYDSYISKHGTKFIRGDSSQRFIKVECTSTYPRILFIIKFIPVLKGIIVVHLYYQSKLSRQNNNNISINHENKYKEVDLVFGSFFGENGDMDLKYVMPKKLANIEKFLEEFFLTTRNCDLFKLNEPNKEFKYFNYYIIKIINSIPNEIFKSSFENIFEYINDKIKNKYKEELLGSNKNKIKIRKIINNNNISESLDKNNDESNKNTIYIKKSKQSHNNSSIDSINKIFTIDKQYLYNDLFPNTSIKFTTIQNNFSTIKSNNKNIINILRESESTINNNNNFIKRKNTEIKEEKNLIKSNTKTITLITESNLISKDDEENEENIDQDISNDFSLISTIKKNENNNLFKLKFFKKENTNLKNLNLQDLLNTSNSIKNINIKGKIKNTEESVSDLINKDYNSTSNIMRKKNNIKIKKGKPRTKLALFNNDN